MSAEARQLYNLPSNVTVAKNAIQAIRDVALHAARTGMVRAPQHEIDRRAAICRACDKYLNGACTVCGCNARLKVTLAGMWCPLKPPKWNKWEEPKS